MDTASNSLFDSVCLGSLGTKWKLWASVLYKILK